MIKLILTDLDETLVHYGLERATDHALDAIHHAQAAGIHFAPITGRIRTGAARAFGGDPASTATAAISNGQIVLVDGRVAREEPLDPTGMGLLARHLADDPDCLLNVLLGADTWHPRRVVVSTDPHAAGRAYVADSTDVSTSPTLPEGPIVKANIHVVGDFDHMGERREELQALATGLDLLSPGPQVPMFDIAPAGWSKARGAEVLRKCLGLGPDEVCVFGDAENDLEMIRSYRNSVAVSNAIPEVAEAATWHIGSTADDAVADAIEEIARAAEAGETPRFMTAEANERGIALRAHPMGKRSVESLPIFTPPRG